MSKKAQTSAKKNVVIGILGTKLDKKDGSSWKPSVQLASQPEFPISRFYLLYSGSRNRGLAKKVEQQIKENSPPTEVTLHAYSARDPWDFKDVSSALYKFVKEFTFDPETEDCYVHITTGTEIAKMCWCLFIQSDFLRAKMVQSITPDSGKKEKYNIFEPDLKDCPECLEALRKKYAWSSEFFVDTPTSKTIKEECLMVAGTTKDPLLLTGKTGTGKTSLAKEIREYLIKDAKEKYLNSNSKSDDEIVPFIECNCATLLPERANSDLFGHEKGAFTDAKSRHRGYLERADGGILFLDEVGELPQGTQAMLLKAIDEGCFERVGGEEKTPAKFFLICATNKDLHEAVKKKTFREDLLARIDTWRGELESFQIKVDQEVWKERLKKGLDFWNKKHGKKVTMTDDVKELFLQFAEAPNTPWKANYRDLNKIITRMATYALAEGNTITEKIVQEQITRLRDEWKKTDTDDSHDASKSLSFESVQSHPLYEGFKKILQKKGKTIDDYDEWEVWHLLYLLPICRNSKNGADAARKLFKNVGNNPSLKMKQHLDKFKLEFEDCLDKRANS